MGTQLPQFSILDTAGYRSLLKSLVRGRIESVKRGDFEENLPWFIWGPPGIGKSMIAAEVAREMDALFFDIRLSQLDPSDLRGVPVYDQVEKKAEFVRFESVLPSTDEKRPVIIILDELPLAAQLVQDASYQLINDRKLGGYCLPVNAIIIAAGNREDDGGNFIMPSPALKSRFLHAELTIDYDGFIDYMNKQNYDENLFAYLYTNKFTDKDKLYNFKPANFAFPTFRTWEKAAIAIKYGIPYDIAIGSAVGNYLAADFAIFKDLTKDIPDGYTIFKKKLYYEGVEKQLVASQKVGNLLLQDESRNKMTPEEKFEYFKYFINMHNPKDLDDKRDELTILFLTNLKENLDVLDEINAGLKAQVKAGKFVPDKSWGMEKTPSLYDLITARYAVVADL
jgi:hypothetical protein